MQCKYQSEVGWCVLFRVLSALNGWVCVVQGTLFIWVGMCCAGQVLVRGVLFVCLLCSVQTARGGLVIGRY